MLWFHPMVQSRGYPQESFAVLVQLMFVIFHLVRMTDVLGNLKSRALFVWILDEQNCILKFASWTYDSARIDLSQKTNIGDLSNLMANSGRLR